MGDQKKYILLTGPHERKVFDLFNILRKNHPEYELLLFDYKDNRFSLPLVYGKKIYKLPNANYREFSSALLQQLEAFKGCPVIYIPLLDNYNGLFYQFMQQEPGWLITAMPSLPDFNKTINKIKFQQFCEKAGFPVPRSFNRDDRDYLFKNFIPLIVKPNTGAGSVGISFINNLEELAELERIDFNKYLVQERIGNIHIEGAFFLMSKGSLVSYYGHRRIRVFPETGGVTVFSEYHHNDKLKEKGAELLAKLQWHGLAMVEFLYDANADEYKIIEVNPRLWGSLMLAEFANTGIIENYLNICMQVPVKSYEHNTNSRIRWFYPFDLLLYFKQKGKIKGFWNFDRKHTCYINFTYAGIWRSCIYRLYFTINIHSIRRFYEKLLPGKNKN